MADQQKPSNRAPVCSGSVAGEGTRGRAVLSQAQSRLENLQALKILESVASESFGLL